MKYVIAYRQQVFRFHRWSRKAYAAFSSMSLLVTFGRACKGIADASLRKSGVMPLSLYLFSDESSEDNDECPPGEEMDGLFSCLAPVTAVMSLMAVSASKSAAEACASCHSVLSEGNSLRLYNSHNTPGADDAKVNFGASSALSVPVRQCAGPVNHAYKYQIKL